MRTFPPGSQTTVGRGDAEADGKSGWWGGWATTGVRDVPLGLAGLASAGDL